MGVYPFQFRKGGFAVAWVYDDDPSGTDSQGNTLHDVTDLRITAGDRDVAVTTRLTKPEKEWEREDTARAGQERTFNIAVPNRFQIALVPNPFAGEPGEPDFYPQYTPEDPTTVRVEVVR